MLKNKEICTIYEYFGKDACEPILPFHAVTDSDKSSYFFPCWQNQEIQKTSIKTNKDGLVNEIGQTEK